MNTQTMLSTLLALPFGIGFLAATSGCSDGPMEPEGPDCAAIGDFFDCFSTEGCTPSSGDDITFVEPDGQSCYFAEAVRPAAEGVYFHCRAGEIGAGDDPQYVLDPETGACVRFYSEADLPPEGWAPCADELPACVPGDCAAITDEATCDTAIGCNSGTGVDVTGMAPDGSLCQLVDHAPGAEEEFFWCRLEIGIPPPVIEYAINPDDGHCYIFVDPFDVPPEWSGCAGDMPMCE